MSTLLEVKDITKIYPNQPKPGLDHVSFEVMPVSYTHLTLPTTSRV